jgi:glycosyltransferase involved in cell wall biosynthesis
MRALYCHDNAYWRLENGETFAEGQFAYGYWQTYLEHFSHLTVLGRVQKGSLCPPAADRLNRSDGPQVDIKLLPNSNSLVGQLRHRRDVQENVEDAVRQADVVILRTMGEITWYAFKAARRFGKMVVVEMAGCPWDNMWYHGSLKAKLFALVRWLRARRAVAAADAVLFVTKEFLQKRYPAQGFTGVASNVRIKAAPASVIDQRLSRHHEKRRIVIGLIGNLHNRLKGIDVALKSLGFLFAAGVDIELRILGSGDLKIYETLIRTENLQGRIFHDGLLPSGEPVLQWLDGLDIYIQPSFHEGLPRALIEAMSRGLPVFASSTGGIPELLQSKSLHKPGDWRALARQLLLFMAEKSSWPLTAELSKTVAEKYTSDHLQPIRYNFWKRVADQARTRSSL